MQRGGEKRFDKKIAKGEAVTEVVEKVHKKKPLEEGTNREDKKNKGSGDWVTRSKRKTTPEEVIDPFF